MKYHHWVMNRRLTGRQKIFGALVSLLFLFVTGCSQPHTDNSATLHVQVPASQVSNAKRAAFRMSGVLSNITRIAINVTAHGEQIAGGEITSDGGEIKLTVPAVVTLTVDGSAYDGDKLLFTGSSVVPALSVGGSASVGLLLTAVDGNLPPIVITARTVLDTNMLGKAANGASNGAIFSADNRYVLFRSKASDLVSGDNDNAEDLFQKDLATNLIAAMTSSRDGQTYGFTGAGERPYGMSSDGRYVVFAQTGGKLNSADTNQTLDLFIKDTRTLQVTRLVEGPKSAQSVTFPLGLAVSGNAQRIAFETGVPPQGQNSAGVFLNDAVHNALRYIDNGVKPGISDDGGVLTYWSYDSSAGAFRLYVVDLAAFLAQSSYGPSAAGVTSLKVLANPPASQSPAPASLSADGNLISIRGHDEANTFGNTDQLIVYQRNPQSLKLLSTASNGVALQGGSSLDTTPSLSIMGNVATFTFGAANTVYIKDTQSGQLVAVSGGGANATLSPDAKVVAFASSSDGHVYLDANPLFAPAPVNSAPDVKNVNYNNSTILSWEPVVGATNYTVYAATDTSVNASNYQQLGGVKFDNVSSPFAVPSSSLPSNGTYYFVVVPANTASIGPASAQVTAAIVKEVLLSGTISGLQGSGLVLQNNGGDNLTINANATSFTFAASVPSNNSYEVKVFTQPSNPTQTCTVSNATGIAATTNIGDVAVTCSANSIGGNVTGLVGNGMVLQNNGGNNLTISGNGPFAFSAPIASGDSYAVTVLTQPIGPAQNCTVTNGSGGVSNANISNVSVSCAPLVTASTPIIATSNYNSCAVNSAGALQCWGFNGWGVLGNGSLVSSSIPQAVPGMNSGVTAVGLGDDHACAVIAGAVKCWGYNGYGQLGNGTSGNSTSTTTPVAVTGLSSGVKDVVGGHFHSCALTNAGAVLCWGRNDFGQLGIGSTANVSVPTAVVGLSSGVTAISANGENSCALVGGAVQCWGSSDSGQLGNGTSGAGVFSNVPVVVTGLSNMTAVASGYFHSCALSNSGGVLCWGKNTTGQLGNATNTDSPVPVAVTGLSSGVAMISAGAYDTCALTNTGAEQCWGYNGWGELGSYSANPTNTPLAVSGLNSGVIAISNRGQHSCALTSTGAMQCWGQNGQGQLGNGTTYITKVPVAVTGLSSGVSKIAAGYYHSCVVNGAGGVQCWGYNNGAVLGNGDPAYVIGYPVTVTGLSSGATDVAVGVLHICALTNAGTVKCWGYGSLGSLGDGIARNNTTPSLTPVDVKELSGSILSGVIAIAAGDYHTCALTNTGAVKCWGYNLYGQLGNGANVNTSTAVAVTGLSSGVTAITLGSNHSCALLNTGAVRCWGFNRISVTVGGVATLVGAGQLGNGTTTDSNLPVAVTGLSGSVATIAAGAAHTCAVVDSGSMQCWGDNASGQLGNGTNTQSSTPVTVTGLSNVSAITAHGYAHVCALNSGAMWCWGYNGFSQLGNGAVSNSNVPVAVTGLSSGVTAITTGQYHSCALTSTGSMKCWGENLWGQLGDGANEFVPGSVRGAAGSQGALNLLVTATPAVTAGTYHTCAATSAGGVKCWGSNFYGQLGDGTTGSTAAFTVPVSVAGLSAPVTGVAGGEAHTCAVTDTGAVQCWGRNNFGQLGNGLNSDSGAPVSVTGLSGTVAEIATGKQHSCVLTTRGGVQCWGNNSSGQLGTGNTANSNVPVTVLGMESGMMAISAGNTHTCALTLAGAVKCWGANANGQLGNGFNVSASTPVAVTGLSSGVTAITLGENHSCALLITGAVQCWGYNWWGQLGNGVLTGGTDSNVPVAVVGLSGTVSAIEAGGTETCALTNAGAVLCWGNNQDGQLGNGTTTQSGTPVAVTGLSSGVGSITGVGGAHACAVSLAGEIQCWGYNANGQIGNGGTANMLSPVYVIGFGG